MLMKLLFFLPSEPVVTIWPIIYEPLCIYHHVVLCLNLI